MQIHKDIHKLPSFKNAVVTIGSFDGIHIGHQKILEKIKHLAKKENGESVIISFHPHPRSIIYPKDDSLRLLQTIEEKIKVLETFGIDHLVIFPFTVEFSQISPKQYIEEFLLGKFRPAILVIGYDHKFGLNRAGDIDLLRSYEAQHYFTIEEISPQEINEIAVSSTKIRNALEDGNIQTANQFLGRWFSLSGVVVHGEKIGKSIGYPTANIKLLHPNKIIPAKGIYAVLVELEGEYLKGMMYIGNKPTLKGIRENAIEVHILDYTGNLYNQFLYVQVIEFIREDQKFSDLDSLIKQIELDELRSREILEFHLAALRISPPAITILIPNKNQKENLELFLPFVADSSTQYFKIQLIDFNSEDSSYQYVSEWYPEIKLIQHVNYTNTYKAINLASEEIKSEFLVILDPSVKITKHWLDPIVKYLNENPEIAVIQPMKKSEENPSLFDHTTAAGGQVDILNYPFSRGRILDKIEYDNGEFSGSFLEVFWAGTSAMVIRSDIFEKFGKFDEDLDGYFADLDFCWRVKNAGYKVINYSEVEVFNRGTTFDTMYNPESVYLKCRNNLIVVLKNESTLNLLWKTPIRFSVDMSLVLWLLFKGKTRLSWSVVKAYTNIALRMPGLIKKRRYNHKVIQQNQLGSFSRKGRQNVFMIWKYFSSRREKFQKIQNY